MADDALLIAGVDALNRRLGELARQTPAAMGRMLFQAGEAIREYMISNYLSGQRLRRRTGRLAGSFSTIVLHDVAVVGTRLSYARIHEQGFHGDALVRSHFRRPARADTSRASRLGAEQNHTIYVRSHLMRMNASARWYARDAHRHGAPKALRVANAVVRRWIESGDARG